MRRILHLRGKEKRRSTWAHLLRRGGRASLRVWEELELGTVEILCNCKEYSYPLLWIGQILNVICKLRSHPPCKLKWF
jgi:hypothetical protein